MTIHDLKPQSVWASFHALTQIPRPSGHTEKVAEFLVKFAKDHGADAYIDKAGNVLINVPATPGYENKPCVVLQGHMDMVPQKGATSNHDFEKDPIETIVDGDWLRANDTTLGADDGMGIAIAMAFLVDKSLPHGPLEILATRDEETGMFGANEIGDDELKAQMMINIDSETEGEITIGCAGGENIKATLEYQEEGLDAEEMMAYKVEIHNLLGGHSGLEINLGRANANKLMARILFELVCKEGFILKSWNGGNMRNAIPHDVEAIVVLAKEDKDLFVEKITKMQAIFRNEYKDIEKLPVTIEYNEVEVPAMVIPEEIGVNIVNAVMAVRDGVMRYIPTIPSIVETSVNLSIINCAEGTFDVCMLARSATDTMKEALCNEISACFSMAGMKVVLSGGYSGWQPNTESKLLKTMTDVYKRMYGEDAKVLVVHAGLECGIIGPKYPELDMVSVGPTLLSPHTPNERCFIPSVETSFNYICEVLKNI